MGFPVGLGIDAKIRLIKDFPCGEQPVHHVENGIRVRTLDTNHGQGPIQDFDLDFPFEPQMLNFGFFDRKGVPSALKMIVRQDGTPDDRQTGIGTDQVMRELIYEVDQFAESVFVDPHGFVDFFQDDAMLVKIGIRRILESPSILLPVQ